MIKSTQNLPKRLKSHPAKTFYCNVKWIISYKSALEALCKFRGIYISYMSFKISAAMATKLYDYQAPSSPSSAKEETNTTVR